MAEFKVVPLTETETQELNNSAASSRRAAFMQAPEISRTGIMELMRDSENPGPSIFGQQIPTPQELSLSALSLVTTDPFELGMILRQADPDIGIVQAPPSDGGEFFAVRRVLDADGNQTGEKIFNLNRKGLSPIDVLQGLGITSLGMIPGFAKTAATRTAGAGGLQAGIQATQSMAGGDFNAGEVVADAATQGVLDTAGTAFRAATRPRARGMVDEATTLRDWLKGELADWMSAERDGTLDSENYFVYDPNWSTLLGMEESFASHQQLNDHHFHYGYFIRAAAEVCRVDKAFCSDEQYGQMFELLIRDYAGGKNDPMFPYLRNFDPANGFSWASGHANFVRGNNNESTSEAANAYGAMVLYGLVTGNDDIMERGMYLHASTSATYWEYWNDIDGYLGGDPDARNFPSGYPRITTSIIWGDGSAFSTWFSPAFAHILGIQGLPSNPLIMHVGLYADYLDDYVTLGLEESPNGKPSGLPNGHWTDLWWNLWSMTDADAAIADYEATASYEPEAGEAPAHTYHWIYTMRALGELQTGTGALTADYPAAMAFETDAGVTSYVVYNYSDEAITVTFSDGTVVEAAANAFAIEQL